MLNTVILKQTGLCSGSQTQKWTSGSLCEWLILSPSYSWTSGSSLQQAAITRTGLTGLLRGALSKNTPYLCAIRWWHWQVLQYLLLFNFSAIRFSPRLSCCASPLFVFWSWHKPFGKYLQLSLIQQLTEQHLQYEASFSAPLHTKVSVFL